MMATCGATDRNPGSDDRKIAIGRSYCGSSTILDLSSEVLMQIFGFLCYFNAVSEGENFVFVTYGLYPFLCRWLL